MYDWPEVRAETDRLWRSMADALRQEGIAAPDELARHVGYEESWMQPDLVLGQACGLPFIEGLSGDAQMIGAMRLGLRGCEPGQYYSQVVRRKQASDSDCTLFQGRLACNALGSQSGYACLKALSGWSPPEPLVTGSHRASVMAVAEGRADYAAIDAASWELALAHEPAALELRVVTTTPPTPAPVLIAHTGADIAAYRRALADFVVVKEREDYLSLL